MIKKGLLCTLAIICHYLANANPALPLAKELFRKKQYVTAYQIARTGEVKWGYHDTLRMIAQCSWFLGQNPEPFPFMVSPLGQNRLDSQIISEYYYLRQQWDSAALFICSHSDSDWISLVKMGDMKKKAAWAVFFNAIIPGTGWLYAGSRREALRTVGGILYTGALSWLGYRLEKKMGFWAWLPLGGAGVYYAAGLSGMKDEIRRNIRQRNADWIKGAEMNHFQLNTISF